jgi:rare lipoprotein A (peptidoglycan hydrolase)
VQPGNVTVTAISGQMTLSASASTMLRSGMTFSGVLPRSDAGQTVEIERLGHQTNWQWAPTVTAAISDNGTFGAAWTTNHIGRFWIRALISQPDSSSAASAPPTVTVTVYRPSIATEYGPGLYGRRTACGERLGQNTIGVANRTLRCGTKVAIYYGGRTMIVPVIDRGPYANHADWDLTEAVGRAIGLPGIAKIGAVSLPPQPPLP